MQTLVAALGVQNQDPATTSALPQPEEFQSATSAKFMGQNFSHNLEMNETACIPTVDNLATFSGVVTMLSPVPVLEKTLCASHVGLID